MTILVVAVSAALDASGQSKQSARARMLNSSGSVTNYCDGYTLSASSDGSLDITCSNANTTPPPTTPPPTQPPQAGTEKGVVQFAAPTSYTVNRPTSTPAVNVPINVTRIAVTNPTGGVPTLGAVTSNIMVAWGNCTPLGVSIPFTIPDGVQSVTLPNGTVMGNTAGTCGIAMTGGDVDPNQKSRFTSAFPIVAVVPDQTPPPPTPPPGGGGSCTNSAGQTITEPSNIVMQTMYLNGSNNYAIDSLGFVNPAPGNRPDPFNVGTNSPAGSIQVFTLPTVGPGNVPVNVQTVMLAPWVLLASGVQYEAAFSKCKGDFSYYKTATATNTDFGTPFQPCGVQGGDSGMNLSWGVPPNGSYSTCQVNTGETWYMNWRVVPGTAGTCGGTSGHTCGQTFITSPS